MFTGFQTETKKDTYFTVTIYLGAREFLIEAILNGGEEEFCKPRVDALSAVGEYAGIAGGINRPPGITFDEVKDQRLVPVLIRCLAAPDNVYPKIEDQGCVLKR